MNEVVAGTAIILRHDLSLARDIHAAVIGDSELINDLDMLTFAEVRTLLIKANRLSEVILSQCRKSSKGGCNG